MELKEIQQDRVLLYWLRPDQTKDNKNVKFFEIHGAVSTRLVQIETKMHAFKGMFHKKSDGAAPNNNNKIPEDETENKESDDTVDADEVDAYNSETLEDQNKSIIWAIIKQLKIGSEVKHLQLPTFVLQPRSTLEKLTDSFLHPSLLFDIVDYQTPEERFFAAVRWFISSWHIRPKGVKNPLNPAVGEFFQCRWDLPDGTTSYYIAEQLSHHPPHTGALYYNAQHGIAICSNIAPAYIKFYGNSAQTNLNGANKIFVFGKEGKYEEVYEFTLPGALVRGILIGTLVLEIVGKATMACQATGFHADMEFKGKKMFRGKMNEVEGKIRQGKQTLYEFEGPWDGVTHITNLRSKEKGILFDASKHAAAPITVAPLEEQQPNESRRYWYPVVKHMLRREEELALEEKRKLEAVKRQEAADREKNNQAWVPQLFTPDATGFWYYNKWNEIVEQIRAARRS